MTWDTPSWREAAIITRLGKNEPRGCGAQA
jgi:hypothetical protein